MWLCSGYTELSCIIESQDGGVTGGRWDRVHVVASCGELWSPHQELGFYPTGREQWVMTLARQLFCFLILATDERRQFSSYKQHPSAPGHPFALHLTYSCLVIKHGSQCCPDSHYRLGSTKKKKKIWGPTSDQLYPNSFCRAQVPEVFIKTFPGNYKMQPELQNSALDFNFLMSPLETIPILLRDCVSKICKGQRAKSIGLFKKHIWKTLG